MVSHPFPRYNHSLHTLLWYQERGQVQSSILYAFNDGLWTSQEKYISAIHIPKSFPPPLASSFFLSFFFSVVLFSKAKTTVKLSKKQKPRAISSVIANIDAILLLFRKYLIDDDRHILFITCCDSEDLLVQLTVLVASIGSDCDDQAFSVVDILKAVITEFAQHFPLLIRQHRVRQHLPAGGRGSYSWSNTAELQS